MRVRIIRGLAAAWAAAGLFGLALSPTAIAQDDTKSDLDVELNKLEDVNGSCHGSFVVFSRFKEPIKRLTLDLYIFDQSGVISQHTVLDIGPVPPRKTRILTFSLINDLCENIQRIVINDIPNCEVESGQPVDCLSGTAAWSRTGAGFSL